MNSAFLKTGKTGAYLHKLGKSVLRQAKIKNKIEDRYSNDDDDDDDYVIMRW
jgi:hypothetical protein